MVKESEVGTREVLLSESGRNNTCGPNKILGWRGMGTYLAAEIWGGVGIYAYIVGLW